jgi:hypothetical protein
MDILTFLSHLWPFITASVAFFFGSGIAYARTTAQISRLQDGQLRLEEAIKTLSERMERRDEAITLMLRQHQ